MYDISYIRNTRDMNYGQIDIVNESLAFFLHVFVPDGLYWELNWSIFESRLDTKLLFGKRSGFLRPLILKDSAFPGIFDFLTTCVMFLLTLLFLHYMNLTLGTAVTSRCCSVTLASIQQKKYYIQTTGTDTSFAFLMGF
jgi:hypothetical protein